MISEKESLERLYLAHHGTGKYGRLRSPGRGFCLAKWIGKGKQVLDLGCRDGELTRFFAEGNQITGTDVDRKPLELAKDKLGIETCWLCSAPNAFRKSAGIPIGSGARERPYSPAYLLAEKIAADAVGVLQGCELCPGWRANSPRTANVRANPLPRRHSFRP